MQQSLNKITLFLLLFNSSSNAGVPTCLKDYKKAFDNVAPHVRNNEIRLNTWTEYGFNQTTHHYDYYASGEVITKLKGYNAERANLEFKNLVEHAGDSFILGALIAAGSKFTANENLKKKIFIGFLVILPVLTVIKNKLQLKNTPYFDWYLQEHKDMFSIFSAQTFLDSLGALVGGTVGYLGTDFVIDRASEFYKNLKDKFASK